MDIYEKLLMIKEPSREETFEMARDVWNHYRLSKDKENEKPRLLEFIEEVISRQDNSDAWYIFAPDKKISKEIQFLNQKNLAKKNLSYYLSSSEETKDFILYMGTQVLCTSRDDNNFSDYKQVWKNVFKNVSIFESCLEKTILENQKNRDEFIQKHSQQIQEKVEPIEKQLYSFKVPFSCSNPQFNNDATFAELKKDILAEFNYFKMEDYFRISPDNFKVTQSNYYAKDDFLVIDYYVNKVLNQEELNTLTKSISGQMSDGFGSNMSQRPILCDTEVVYMEFDYQNITPVEEPKTKNKMKP